MSARHVNPDVATHTHRSGPLTRAEAAEVAVETAPTVSVAATPSCWVRPESARRQQPAPTPIRVGNRRTPHARCALALRRTGGRAPSEVRWGSTQSRYE